MKYSGIGGQAVIEGVMMRNGKQCAVAVRKPDGEIEVKKETVTSLRDRYAIARVPVIRGIVSFVESLSSGMKTLNYSASFYEEEEEKQEKTEEGEKEAGKERQYPDRGCHGGVSIFGTGRFPGTSVSGFRIITLPDPVTPA